MFLFYFMLNVCYYCQLILQRKHILQILIFLNGKENIGQLGGFSYSKNKEVADQQRKYILFAFLFMEALKKNTVTETDLTTLQRMWGQHLLSLVNNGMEKAAERYERSNDFSAVSRKSEVMTPEQGPG